MQIHITPIEKLKKMRVFLRFFGSFFNLFRTWIVCFLPVARALRSGIGFSKIHYFCNDFSCKNKTYYKPPTKMPSNQQTSQRFSDLIQPFSHAAIQPFSNSAIQPFNHSAIQPIFKSRPGGMRVALTIRPWLAHFMENLGNICP